MNLKNEKLYFFIALSLCLFLSAIFLYRGILPGIRIWSDLKKELAHKQEALDRLYSTVRENELLTKQIAQTEETYKSLNKMLFLPNDVSAAVKEIADISQDLEIGFSSLLPQSIRLTKSSAETGFSLWETPILIKMKTNYPKLLDFIKRVEKSVKFMSIQDFQVKKNTLTPLIHEVQMTLCVYSLKQEKVQ